MIQFAERIQTLQTNVFADMDEAKARAKAQGQPIIDLTLGSSDLPAAEPVVTQIAEALADPSTHGYLLFHGTQAFRVAAAQWYTQRYGVPVDPETEVLPLIGSQEGTAHLPLAILNPGDYALLTDPGYPSHAGGVALASGQVYSMPLLAEHDFLPVFAAVPESVLVRAKLMVLSYPHNPTTAVAPLSFFDEAMAFCRAHDLVLVHDFPYADLVFGAGVAPSMLQADPSKERTVELFTLSKSYNMGGFRVGYAIGNAQVIQALRQMKAVIDFNQYRGILAGAIAALTGPPEQVQTVVETFAHRREIFVQTLRQLGWHVPMPEATMYVWARLPAPWDTNSMKFCVALVEATGVAVSPGSGFGPYGEGYVRFALVHEPAILAEAAHKIMAFLQR